MTTPSTAHRFQLRKGHTRVQVAVQELDHDVVIASGEVYETDHAGVAHALDRQPALERAKDSAKEKGGDA